MEKVLVTGGAGFIGSHLVEALVKEDCQVRVLDNLSTGTLANLQKTADEIEFVKGDIRDRARVEKVLEGVDVVFHQAAFVSVPDSMQDPESCFEINVGGTHQLLEAARRQCVRRVVIASSAAVYGDNPDFPLRESASVGGRSPYAVSKRVGELYARLYTRTLSLDVVALRYFNVYGPRQRADSDYAAVIPIFIRRSLNGQPPVIFGDGTQSRDFVYIKDVVRANLAAASRENLSSQIFNVCSGDEVSVQELWKMIREITSSAEQAIHKPERPGDIYRSLGDPERAAKELGFRSREPITEGLAHTVSWMQEKIH